MQQIRIFKGLEAEIKTLETEINEWIAQSGVKVVNVVGNIAPQSVVGDKKSSGLGRPSFASSDVMLIVVYEKA